MDSSITLPHPADDLRGKRITFRFHSSRGDPVEIGIASGEGVLVVDGPDDDGLFKAFIHVESFDGIPGGPGTWNFTDICLDQRAADCLKVLEDGSLLCLDATLQEADHPKKPMSCGICGEPMHRGYICLVTSYPATIQWLSERPTPTAWRFWKHWQGDPLLYDNQRMTPNTVCAAHRCPKCHTLTIEHIDI